MREPPRDTAIDAVKPPAQTNIQLFNQLADQAYTGDDIARVRGGYVLAMRIFSGRYRASGKTFIAHAIGTASTLAAVRAPGYVVAAGLLHSAYTFGEFGTLRRAIDQRKRNQVREVVGPAAEELVEAYARMAWDERCVNLLLSDARELPSTERELLLIRLANEIDEYAECAALYAANWESRVAAARSFLPQCVNLAERLGAYVLADELRAVGAQTLSESRPRSVTSSHGASTLIAPASHVPRPHVIARAFADRLRSKLRRA